jgi:hypothetical protein
LQPPGVVSVGESGDPFGGGGEQHPVPGLAGADAQPDGEHGLARSRRAEEDDVVAGAHEVQGAQVRDDLAAQGPLVVVVEVFQGLPRWESGCADASLAAVGFPGGDLALQAGGQELLVGPGFGACPPGQPGHRVAQRGRLQGPGQEGKLGAHIPGSGLGGHHATACCPAAAAPGWPSSSVTHRQPDGSCPSGRMVRSPPAVRASGAGVPPGPAVVATASPV